MMDLDEHVLTDLSMPSSIGASSYGVQVRMPGSCSGNGTPPPPSAPPPAPPSDQQPWTKLPKKAAPRYRECMKNHAASIGGHAIDGCGEFMPSGDDGTMEALKCAACDCHRNFHRREVDGEQPPATLCSHCLSGVRRPPGSPPPSLPLGRAPMLMALNSRRALEVGEEMTAAGEEAPTRYGGQTLPVSPMKKRFRTKFSGDQKEKMCAFSQTLGWRIQKQDEMAVQQFCAEVGVKRHVLKVWMHNNKHTFGKKHLPSLSPPYSPPRHHRHHHQLPYTSDHHLHQP